MKGRSLTYDSHEAAEAKRIGLFLRLHRLSRNLSHDEMALRIGVTRKTYAAVERAEPTVSVGAFLRTLRVLSLTEAVTSALTLNESQREKPGHVA